MENKKRFIILIEDDFEVQGNGLGNVADLQYLPALALMNIAQKHGVKATFMADIAHLITLRDHLNNLNNDRNLRLQKTIADETLLMIKERGFDVQLHLHPQWLGAKRINSHFHVSRNWNIGKYSASEQIYLITESINYLHTLLLPNFPLYKTIAFKAGSWGIQPSETILQQCLENGIRIIIAVRAGLKTVGAGVDYTNLEEKYLPYHPEISDITKVNATPNGFIVVPLQPYTPDFLTLARLSVDTIRRKLFDISNWRYYEKQPIPPEIESSVDHMKKNSFRFSLRQPYLTHLKISNQPFSCLKASFDSVIKKLRNLDAQRIPIVIESHSKLYHNYYHHIDKFFGYMADTYYDEIEFQDLTGFLNEITENPDLVCCKQRASS